MKLATIALAILAAHSTASWAQSSVTLYGIVDVGLRFTTNSGSASDPGASLKQVVPGGMSNSRLGVNVAEDLGGGLKALVNLEHRLNSDTGAQAAGEFWRQAWVGVESSDFGRVALGRQYNVLFDLYTGTYSSFKYSPYIEAFRPETVMVLGGRQSNMVKYVGQTGGLRFAAQASAGEGTSVDKSLGGYLRYEDSGLAVGGGYLEASEVSGAKAKAMTVGVGYAAGPLYVNAAWGRNDFDRAAVTLQALFTANYTVSPGSKLGGRALDVRHRDMFSAGLTYQLTNELNLGVQGWYAKQTHHLVSGNSTAAFGAVVADYALSKRTDLYAEMDYSRLGGSLTYDNGRTSRLGLMTGVRHRF
ncbi:porin [Roseateles sp. BYS180W]|uniref:Porin n=1 Tax=Roseateles rivi TaxID=3299028 RepID=A0ABW7FRK4_9BURK